MLEEKDLQAIAQLMEQKLDPIKADISGMKDQLGQMSERLIRVEDQSQRTAVLLESDVDRKLNLLYEGHSAIMERLDRLAPRSRVEELESDVALLKNAVKLLRLEIETLKRAQ